MSIEQSEHLAQLIKHPGYLLYREHVRKLWGAEGYGRQMKQALGRTDLTAQEFGVLVKCIDYANTEINALLSWPEEQARKVTPVEAPVRLQRGGA